MSERAVSWEAAHAICPGCGYKMVKIPAIMGFVCSQPLCTFDVVVSFLFVDKAGVVDCGHPLAVLGPRSDWDASEIESTWLH